MLSIPYPMAGLLAVFFFFLGAIFSTHHRRATAPAKAKPAADDSNVTPVEEDEAYPLRALYGDTEIPAPTKRGRGRPRKTSPTPARRSDTAITRPMPVRPGSRTH